MSEFSLSFQRGGNFHRLLCSKEINKPYICSCTLKIMTEMYQYGNVPILINTHVVIKIHKALVTYFDSRKPFAFEQS